MAISECFKQMNYVEAVFNPIPSYDGYWTFSVDNLFENSLKENDQNKFAQFYFKTYQEPLLAIFHNEAILKNLAFMVSLPKENKIGRMLKYSEHHFYISLIEMVNHHLDRYGKTKEEQRNFINGLIEEYSKGREAINLALVEAFKAKALKLKDVIDKEINSEYFEVAREDYEIYGKDEEFREYIEKSYQLLEDLIMGMPKLGDFFDHPVDYQKLASCFDDDTFSLMFAKIIYEYCVNKKEGHLPNCYQYLMFYKKAIEEMIKTNKRYDPRITFILPSMAKLRRYSRWNFHEEYHALRIMHPEIKEINMPTLKEGEENTYRDINFMAKFNHLYDQEITLNWELLPEGKNIPQGKSTGANHIPSKTKDHDTLVKEVNERITTLENSNFIGRPFKGLSQSFGGYYAFFYANGVVILEKFWENEERQIPVKYAATYVMNIDNFLEMSKMPKANLISYIKTIPNSKRLYHTSFESWQTALYDAINNEKMSEKINTVVDFMNNLESETLSYE